MVDFLLNMNKQKPLKNNTETIQPVKTKDITVTKKSFDGVVFVIS